MRSCSFLDRPNSTAGASRNPRLCCAGRHLGHPGQGRWRRSGGTSRYRYAAGPMLSGNLKDDIPSYLPQELVTALAIGKGVRISRIVSRGQVSPPGFWYDQAEDELVLVIEGQARVALEGQPDRLLSRGDWLVIGAHVRHRVTWTDPTRDTIWLAVFFNKK